MNVTQAMQLVVVWPRPRKERWQLGRTSSHEFPDLSDAFTYLEEHGIEVTIEESLPWPLNALINMHEFYSGLDPLRAARIAARARRYDAVICIGDATAFALVWLRWHLRLRFAIILIDPALSPGYPKRKRLQDYVLPKVDHVIVYGRVQLEYLAREYGSSVRASFLYHRADPDFYQSSVNQAADIPPYIFSVGLDQSRDFETFAHAARRCASTPGFGHRFVLQTSSRPVLSCFPCTTRYTPAASTLCSKRWPRVVRSSRPVLEGLRTT